MQWRNFLKRPLPIVPLEKAAANVLFVAAVAVRNELLLPIRNTITALRSKLWRYGTQGEIIQTCVHASGLNNFQSPAKRTEMN